MTLSEIERAAQKAGMQTRWHPEGGLEMLASGANLYADPSGEVRVLVQASRRDGELALRDLIACVTGKRPPKRSELESVRKLAVKALMEARKRHG